MIPLLLEASLRSAALVVGVFLLLRLWRVREPAWRDAAWTVAAGAMLLMPLLQRVTPEIAVTVVDAPFPVLPVEVVRTDSGVGVGSTSDVATVPEVAPRRVDVWAWLYLAGVGLLTLRLAVGWMVAVRLGRTGAAAEPGVFVSSSVAVPMTVGLIRPRIFVPAEWGQWDEATRRAVLAHEGCHAARRDGLWALLARVNVCVFWFHPGAWLAAREMARAAEEACDEAGMRAAGSGERYVEILLAMAGAASGAGGRFSVWALRMAERSGLERRVDRVLGLDSSRLSPGRRWGLVGSVVLVLAAVVACTRSVPALRENPEIAERDRRAAEHQAVVGMTAEQVDALEAVVRSNPEDLAARGRLMTFYAEAGDGVIGKERTVAARRPHVLWVIRNRPGDALAESWGARIFPTDNDRDADPVGYAEAKALWLGHVRKADASAAVLRNAATFFEVADKRLAEELYLRLHGMEPDKGWNVRLGRLYFEILAGSNSSMPQGVLRSVSMAEAHGPYATEVRRKLAESRDAGLLHGVARMLMMHGRQPQVQRLVDFDMETLGKEYLTRAIALEPNSRQSLAAARILAMPLRFRLPVGEQEGTAAQRATAAYIRGDMDEYYRKDAVAAKSAFERARGFAKEALAKEAGDGASVYRANLIAGMLAMRDGDRPRAVRHLLASVEGPASEEMGYSFEYGTYRLPGWLLKDGEREAVIQYLEKLAGRHVSQKAQLLESAELIRKGIQPTWYPR